ncbi:MAB_1171c family putative transporter [Streptomyces sp. NPDC094031]|uniref:MAB_1171c family putative transporter n=1 Tax=Streptomyces sp. NPDC094031 TaxID=3155307 RepID=UPI003331A895
MNLSDFHVPYVLPTALLALAFVARFQMLVRAWRDPDVRATALLLGLATTVFVSVTPINIHRINAMTGVTNIAAPWSYSLLTAFGASCLTMIMRWRETPSEQRRRRIRRVYVIYSAIIAGLWTTFLLADVPVERIYDLDTYYANTPWMREHIELYLAGHVTSTLIAAYMISRWFAKVTGAWLKAGLICLQVGYANGLVYDATKIIAIVARWSGANWDFLSTRLAPPFALLGTTLVAAGFILPQAGPAVSHWYSDARDYRRLHPLLRTLEAIEPSAARARVGRWAPLDLRLVQRQQRIHDAFLRLAPFFDDGLYQQVYDTARTARGETRARGLAGASAIRAAITSYQQGKPVDHGSQSAQIGPDVTDHLDAISAALRHPFRISSLRDRTFTACARTPHDVAHPDPADAHAESTTGSGR